MKNLIYNLILACLLFAVVFGMTCSLGEAFDKESRIDDNRVKHYRGLK